MESIKQLLQQVDEAGRRVGYTLMRDGRTLLFIRYEHVENDNLFSIYLTEYFQKPGEPYKRKAVSVGTFHADITTEALIAGIEQLIKENELLIKKETTT